MEYIIWKVFAGPSLTNHQIEPFTLCLETSLEQNLNDGDFDAWTMFLMFLQLDIKHRMRGA